MKTEPKINIVIPVNGKSNEEIASVLAYLYSTFTDDKNRILESASANECFSFKMMVDEKSDFALDVVYKTNKRGYSESVSFFTNEFCFDDEYYLVANGDAIKDIYTGDGFYKNIIKRCE